MIVSAYWLIPPAIALALVSAYLWWQDGESTSWRPESRWRRRRRQ